MNRGGPCGTGVSVLGPLLLPHVQWSRVLSLVLLPGFLLQSALPPTETHAPAHGTVRSRTRVTPFCSVHERSMRQAVVTAVKSTRKEV